MCIRTFFGLKYRWSIFHIKVIFGNNCSNFANFCITIGPFNRTMLHLSGKNLNSFSSKIALRQFYKSGDDMQLIRPIVKICAVSTTLVCSANLCPFPGGPVLADTRMSPFWILSELRMTELVTSFLQAGCPSCHPTNSVRALRWRKVSSANVWDNILTVYPIQS